MSVAAPTSVSSQVAPLLAVDQLCKYFPVRRGVFARVKQWVKAVDDVSFTIGKGETLGLVGESGCGKTTVGRTLLRLIPATSGRVTFDGKSILDLREANCDPFAAACSSFFQDPYGSLNPRVTVGGAIAEPLKIHGLAGVTSLKDRVAELLKHVGCRPMRPIAIRTSSPAANVSESVLPEPSHSTPTSSSAMNRQRARCFDSGASHQPAPRFAARTRSQLFDD